MALIIALYDEVKVQSLLQDKSIVRNRMKIEAAIINARVFQEIQMEYGSFGNYIWSFTDGNTIVETGLASSSLSDAISKDLKRKGMKFVGSTVI